MKKIALAVLYAVIFFTGVYLFAAYEEKPENGISIPPGMEIIKSGDVNLLVPKGAVLSRVNDLIVLEGAEEYSARKFMIVEERLARIEEELKELKGMIRSLSR